ncbi:MAG: Ferric uptake regulation protein [Marinimicrobia bacterium 46_47]|nr:MAG: Ferric uptake regulation protein [Marinimicrobia bacterium 46_47]KUK89778.1 MAG: transcriptional regulator [Marinimicrobia bacterium 46_43]HBY19043.1 transcriptional repressor [Candidatus Neomarinimicrobiota bacterium]
MNPDILNEILQRLQKEEMKITRQRKRIIEVMYEHRDHIDAEALYLILKQQNAGVSRATIYRTLEMLVEKRLIRKMDFGEGRCVYEFKLGQPHHDHMKCLRCGKVIEFNDHIIELRQNTICQNYKFYPTSHVMQIYGLCCECREKEKKDCD